MAIERRTLLQWTAVSLLLAAAGVIALKQLRSVTATGEEQARIWFYDESAQRLYAVPRDTLPPHVGVDRTQGDGVRAIVVMPPAQPQDANARRVAYLETYTPELKALLEEVRAARATGRAPRRPLPHDDGNYMQRNTLVRRPGETKWYPQTDPQAARIMAEWHTWTATNGDRLVICVP